MALRKRTIMSNKSLIRLDSKIEYVSDELSEELISLPLSEIDSLKRYAIEYQFSNDLNEFETRVIKDTINYYDELMRYKARAYFIQNSFMPPDAKNIVYTNTDKPKKEPESIIKIDDWSEFLIKVHAYRIEFQKKGSSTSQRFSFSDLGWNGLKLEIVKEFSNGYYLKRNDQITSRVSELNKQLCNMFGLEQYPFIYNRRKKYRTSLITIEVYDAEERLLDATLKIDRNVLKNSISDTYHTDYSDDYQHNSMQHHLSLSDMDEDDIY